MRKPFFSESQLCRMQGGRGVGALAARGHHMDAAVHGPAASMRRAVVESDQEPGMPRPSCRLFLFFMGVMRTGGERKFALRDFEEEDYKQCSNSDSAQSRSHVPLWSRAVRASAFARCALLSSLRLDVAGVQGGKHRDAVGAVLGAAGFRSFKEGRLSALRKLWPSSRARSSRQRKKAFCSFRSRERAAVEVEKEQCP